MTDTVQAPELPVGSIGRHAFGWWGMITLIMTEAALFSYLLFSYYYFDAQYGRSWLPDELPAFKLSGPNTIILVASSLALWWGESAMKRGDRRALALGLAAGVTLGLVFVGVQLAEWASKPFTLSSSTYGSVYFTLTGFHMAHVVAGEIMLVALLAWTLLGYFDDRRNAAVSTGILYWHFVDAVWLAVFFTIYVTPHLR